MSTTTRGAFEVSALEPHVKTARRRARYALLAIVVGLALLLFGRWHVLSIDQELKAANAQRTASELYAATWPYMLALAIGLLSALGGVLLTVLSWMYMRDLEKARERPPPPTT